MMRKLFLCCALALTVLACERNLDSPAPAGQDPGQPPLTRSVVNTIVERHLQDTDTPFNWNEDADDHLVWSALEASDNHVALGYQPAGYTDLRSTIHTIDVSAGEWLTVRQELISDLLEATERLTGAAITEEDLLLVAPDQVLPILEFKALHPGIVSEFRHRAEVRYFEPSNYAGGEIDLRGGSGCSEAPSDHLYTADYTTIAPGAKVPWNYSSMNIQAAWGRSRGDGIGIAIIDTGVYPEQEELGGDFDAGYSAGRSITKKGFYAPHWWSSRTDGPNDRCGHGTQMSGLAAAPRTSSGATVGVAYQADLRTYRATSDVIVNGSSEKRGVKRSLIDAANSSATKVISMSIGDVFSSGTVEDGVDYAYNRDKMILAAAGTSLSWTSWWGVIFPASLSRTVAVTGVREGLPLERCNTCHDGNQVDFIAVMQRRNDSDRTSLTLSRYDADPGYVGGSSAATATTAGIAALVWATNPTQSRAQVLGRMKNAASIYPSRNGNFGWGMIDADRAVR